MKASKFFAMAVAVFAFAACSNEEGNPATEQVGRSQLSIRIVGETDAPKGRAADTSTGESTVNDFILYVFKSDGSGDLKDGNPKEYTTWPKDGIVSNLEISTAATEVYVIANTAAATATHAELMAATTKAQLQAVMGRGFASVSPAAVATQTSTNLWMSGKNEEILVPVENKNVTASVTLKYVAAKVRIKSVTVDPKVTGLILSEVQVFNGAGATKFIPSDGVESLIPTYIPETGTPYFVGAAAMKGFQNKPTLAGRNDAYSFALTGNYL